MSTVPPQPWLMQLWYSQSSFCCDWERKPSYFVRFWPAPAARLVVHPVHHGDHDVDLVGDAVRLGVPDLRRHERLELGVGLVDGLRAPGSSSQLQVRGGSSQV